MNRRELLRIISLSTGSALICGELLFTGCTRDDAYRSHVFTRGDVNLLEEIAETIIPRTETPGAKDAGVAAFMTKIVDHCYTAADQKIFHQGLITINESTKRQFGASFIRLEADQRKAFLTDLDREAREFQRPDGGTRHYFTMMKQLTLFSFFTSEVGQTKVLRHVPIPGRYDGCFPYNEGDKAWAI